MAAAVCAVRPRQGQTDARRRGARGARPATAAGLWHFDGRDVTDSAAEQVGVHAGGVAVCDHCGTVRDARLAFCCEFSAVWAETGGVAVAAERSTVYVRAVVAPAAAESAA